MIFSHKYWGYTLLRKFYPKDHFHKYNITSLFQNGKISNKHNKSKRKNAYKSGVYVYRLQYVTRSKFTLNKRVDHLKTESVKAKEVGLI